MDYSRGYFTGVHALLVPGGGSDLTKKIAQILHERITENGGRVFSEYSSTLTHIIVATKASANCMRTVLEQYAQIKHMKSLIAHASATLTPRLCISIKAKVVTPAWISHCVSHKTLVDCTPFLHPLAFEIRQFVKSPSIFSGSPLLAMSLSSPTAASSTPANSIEAKVDLLMNCHVSTPANETPSSTKRTLNFQPNHSCVAPLLKQADLQPKSTLPVLTSASSSVSNAIVPPTAPVSQIACDASVIMSATDPSPRLISHDANDLTDTDEPDEQMPPLEPYTSPLLQSTSCYSTHLAPLVKPEQTTPALQPSPLHITAYLSKPATTGYRKRPRKQRYSDDEDDEFICDNSASMSVCSASLLQGPSSQVDILPSISSIPEETARRDYLKRWAGSYGRTDNDRYGGQRGFKQARAADAEETGCYLEDPSPSLAKSEPGLSHQPLTSRPSTQTQRATCGDNDEWLSPLKRSASVDSKAVTESAGGTVRPLKTREHRPLNMEAQRKSDEQSRELLRYLNADFLPANLVGENLLESWLDRQKNKLACQMPQCVRMVMHNKAVIKIFEELSELHHSLGRQYQSLTYSKAAGFLRAIPFELRLDDVPLLVSGKNGFGKSLGTKLNAIIKTGELKELDSLREECKNIKAFSRIYGVGGKLAAELNGKFPSIEALRQAPQSESGIPDASITFLKYYDELTRCMPREEVTLVANKVHGLANTLLPGIQVMACGSYRRLKPECGDIDIILTHPNPEKLIGFLTRLVFVLTSQGLLTDHLTHPEKIAQRHAELDEWQIYAGICHLGSILVSKESPLQCIQSSSTASASSSSSATSASASPLLLGSLPSSPSPTSTGFLASSSDLIQVGGMHRRIDLKVCPQHLFAFGTLYFTGSAYFNRSMRYWAAHHCLSLSQNGLHYAARVARVKVNNSKPILCQTEEDIFQALQLEYVPPHLRDQ